jgi:hypothetical protein
MQVGIPPKFHLGFPKILMRIQRHRFCEIPGAEMGIPLVSRPGDRERGSGRGRGRGSGPWATAGPVPVRGTRHTARGIMEMVMEIDTCNRYIYLLSDK